MSMNSLFNYRFICSIFLEIKYKALMPSTIILAYLESLCDNVPNKKDANVACLRSSSFKLLILVFTEAFKKKYVGNILTLGNYLQ